MSERSVVVQCSVKYQHTGMSAPTREKITQVADLLGAVLDGNLQQTYGKSIA